MEAQSVSPLPLTPLPLTPFEEYMVQDHHRAYPMVFTIRLTFDGTIDRSRLERSLKVALARHPLLSSTIRLTSRGRHAWHWDSRLPLDLAVVASDAEVAFIGGQRTFPERDVPPMTEHTGLRARIIRASRTENETLAVQFHHVCCDGAGALQFLTDALAAYHFGPELADEHLAPLDPSALARRSRRQLTWMQRLALLPQQLFGLEGARKFFVRQPRPLVNQSWPSLDEPPPEDFSIALQGVLTRSELSAIATAARAKGATTHELMTRDLFLAIRDFQASLGNLAQRKWLRLNIPMNLRRREHQATSAANIVTMVFLDRKPVQMRDRDKLLKSVHDEMSRIKRFDVKYTYLYFAQFLRWMPGGFDLVSRSRKCHATMLLTNLGSVFANLPLPYADGMLTSHNLVLKTVDVTAPYRPLCCATIALVHYNDRMTINVHFDPRALSWTDSQSLLACYMQRLRESAQRGSSKPRTTGEWNVALRDVS